MGSVSNVSAPNSASNGGAANGGAANGGAPNIGYEQARAELRTIVSELESGGQPLEESLALWQRGEELARICSTWLEQARTQLDSAIAASNEAEAGS